MFLQYREELYTAKRIKMTLNNEEINRYSRHLTLPEVGMEGQLKLKEAKVLMIGAGGLGSPLGMYLGAVGVGKLGLVDFDVVDKTNLHRQIAHGASDEGRPKVHSLRDTILSGNPNIDVEWSLPLFFECERGIRSWRSSSSSTNSIVLYNISR